MGIFFDYIFWILLAYCVNSSVIGRDNGTNWEGNEFQRHALVCEQLHLDSSRKFLPGSAQVSCAVMLDVDIPAQAVNALIWVGEKLGRALELALSTEGGFRHQHAPQNLEGP